MDCSKKRGSKSAYPRVCTSAFCCWRNSLLPSPRNMLVKLGALSSDAAGGMLGNVAKLKALAGLACFGFAFLLYSLVLQCLALSLAQAILMQYICMIVGGWHGYY